MAEVFAVYDDEYATCLQTHATLRIFSETLHIDAIQEIIDIQPTHSFAKDARYGPLGEHARRHHGWLCETRDVAKSRDARRHIDVILTLLNHKTEAIRDLHERGCKIDIMIFWVSVDGHGGPQLAPYQMRRLGELEIPIWWDVYFSNRE